MIETILVLAVGLVLIGLGLHGRSFCDPKNWYKTKARIVTVNAKVSDTFKGIVFYKPDIQYTYMVQGREFTSRSYAYASTEDRGNLRKVENLLQRYPVGSEIEIYVRHDRPDQAFVKLVEARVSNSQNVALIVAGVLVSMAVVAITFVRILFTR